MSSTNPAYNLTVYNTASQGHATLLSTHELDGLDQVGEIVVLERGAVAERGTQAQLMLADGLCRRMQACR